MSVTNTSTSKTAKSDTLVYQLGAYGVGIILMYGLMLFAYETMITGKYTQLQFMTYSAATAIYLFGVLWR